MTGTELSSQVQHENEARNVPTIRLQTVLYGNSINELERALLSMSNSLGQAMSHISEWCIVFGDSSPEPLLDAKLIARFEKICIDAAGKFMYQFFGENLGHGGGHNRLHEGSPEDLLLIVNPDGILAPDTVLRLVEALTDGVGIVDARQLPLEHPKEYDAGTGETSWSSLACALTPSKLFSQIGGIDHNTFFMYCDDVDYSWRLRLEGFSAKYCPQARMFHDKRLDSAGNFIAGETERYYSAEAALLLSYKYSRDDVLESLKSVMAASSDPYQQKALVAFQSRQLAGNLPRRLDPEHLIAEFTDGSYGAHRF